MCVSNQRTVQSKRQVRVKIGDMASQNKLKELKVNESIETFTNDFYKRVASQADGNFVSSALSAHVVLAMAAQGAAGKTAKEMKRTLHLSDDLARTQQGFQAFIDSLNSIKNVTLTLANKIYAAKDIHIKDMFKEITATYFRSESGTLDFTKNEESAKEVSQWCNDKTNGKIKDIIKADAITRDMRMILLNAVYFKGLWKHPFEKELTELKPFDINKNETINVPTMLLLKRFFYKEIEELNADCVGLPYVNEDLMFIVVAPKELDGLKKIEDHLDKLNFDYKNEFDSTNRYLFLPKFKIETTIELNDHLRQMGMTEIFGTANFKGIADEPLKVDKVVQKAFIEVNEEGTEAAAVTGVCAVACCMPPPPIVVNKPFYYKLIYKNSTLFSGRVVNPIT